MRNVLKLDNPIVINGQQVTSLAYDTQAITAVLFAQADAAKKQAAGSGSVSFTPGVEFDFALHIYLGFAAIIAVNPQITFNDLERLGGFDLIEVQRIGRNFTLKVDASTPEGLEEPSETTVEPTTQAQ